MRKSRFKPRWSARKRARPRDRTSWLRVAAAVLWRQGRVLLLQRHRNDRHFPLKWEFPGGKVQRQETPALALRRELREELGIHATFGKPLACYRHRYGNGLGVELHFFEVTTFSGRLRNHSAERIRWVPLQQLPTYDVLVADRPLIERLQRSLGRRVPC